MASEFGFNRETSEPNLSRLPEVSRNPSDEVQSLPNIKQPVHSFALSTPKKMCEISVLIINPYWRFDSYGLSSISRSLIENIRSVDPCAKNVNIFCAVLEEEKIPHDQLMEAKELGIKLIGAKQPRGKKRPPILQWLDEDIVKYYQDLLGETKFDFIIGHVPLVANGVLNLKHVLCKRLEPRPKVIMVVHSLPVVEKRERDEDLLDDWLKEADLVLSIGGSIWMEVSSFMKSRNIEVAHQLYLPSVGVEATNLKEDQEHGKLSGEQNIVIMLPDGEDCQSSDLDFELAVVSSAQASQNLMAVEGSTLGRQLSFNLKVISSFEDQNTNLQENFQTVKENHKIYGKTPGFKIVCPKKIEKLKPHLKRATLLVLPLKADSHVFGSETLKALGAGIPILVSKNSGIAAFLHDRGFEEAVVWDGESPEKDTCEWKERLIQKIANPEEALRLAKELRDILQLDLQTTCTHRNFIAFMTDQFCVKLEVNLDAKPVEPEIVSKAVKAGVRLEKLDGPTDAVAYLAAYMQRLICGYNRAKMEPEIHAAWIQVQLLLEVLRRKIVQIGEGKLVLTLYCPTQESRSQLDNSMWVQDFTAKLERLAQILGIGEPKISLGQVEDHGHPLRLRHSSGPDNSEGYETMTVASAPLPGDLQSMIGEDIVSHWFCLRSSSSSDFGVDIPGYGPGLSYVETLNEVLAHVPNMNSFAVSACGSIGITSKSDLLTGGESEGDPDSISRTPSLSVAYPDQGGSPLVLANDKEYWSAVFTGAGHNHLAAVCTEDNSIHLWDLTDGTSKTVYKFKSATKGRKILCLIDKRTVACIDASPGEEHRVEILNTKTEPWTMKTILHVDSVKDIYNMAAFETIDGALCLLVCSPRDHCVQALKVVGGHVRWECGSSQMGELCAPLSACVDEQRTVYVADYLQNKVHLINGDTGSMMRSVDLSAHNFLRPFYVCVLNQFLFVGHLDEAEEKPLISKFE